MRVKEIAIRVIVGGVVVSAFALLGDLLKPKSLAGLFGAGTSVALATLFLTVAKNGQEFARVEARSMILGAVAFFVYASVVSRLLIRKRLAVLSVTSWSMMLWFVCAFCLWVAVVGLFVKIKITT